MKIIEKILVGLGLIEVGKQIIVFISEEEPWIADIKLHVWLIDVSWGVV